MKNHITRIIIAFAMLLTATTACAGIVAALTSEARDWRFIQSVGGMKISAKGTILSVDCDVAGMRTITVKPTMVNSGLGVRKVRHKRQDRTILLTVVTCVIGKYNQPIPKPLDLSTYPDGEYSVEYLDADGARHPVGKITLKK